MVTPVFSDKLRSYNGEKTNVRCSINKKVWSSFKTLASLKRLDIGDVLSDIIRNWIIEFGEVKYTCYNCGMVINEDNSYIILKKGTYINCCSIRCFDMTCDEIKYESK
jgi:hypothetical protein